MARQKKSKLNQAAPDIIERSILLENPEGFERAQAQAIAVVEHVPKMERIVFRNDRDPGIPLEFHYASATHPLHQYKLFHGHEHTLPVEVIEHLESRQIPIYAYRKSIDGHPEMFVNGYKHQFTCKTIRAA